MTLVDGGDQGYRKKRCRLYPSVHASPHFDSLSPVCVRGGSGYCYATSGTRREESFYHELWGAAGPAECKPLYRPMETRTSFFKEDSTSRLLTAVLQFPPPLPRASKPILGETEALQYSGTLRLRCPLRYLRASYAYKHVFITEGRRVFFRERG